MKSENEPDQAEEFDSDLGLSESNSSGSEPAKASWLRRSFNPFRIATLRGLAVVLPPLLTIMVFVWAWNTIDRAILRPVESLAKTVAVTFVGDIREDSEIAAALTAEPPQGRLNVTVDKQVFVAQDGTAMVSVGDQWIPSEVFDLVTSKPGDAKLVTAHDYFARYVEVRYLKRHLIIPAFLAIFLALMYIVGKLLAAGVGRIFWRAIESLIDRLPIIRNVYSSVKQVTDFAFNDSEVQYTRVVAVEYPRKGIWSMGFVTGESLLDIRIAAGEPMLSVLMPTSPMPATGFTVTVPKSETIDLNITIDQAIQFCVSCGVVIPDQQTAKSAIEGEVRRRTQSQSAAKTSTAKNAGNSIAKSKIAKQRQDARSRLEEEE
ncbi:MAG: DUF502 domain-containing protein [Mariniblastus sp.]